MRLKEIEMDLPYKKNSDFICRIQEIENVDYEEALRKDYDINWKDLRRRFQLLTKCMTSMIERIMKPINTTDCWKILFECIDEHVDDKYKNLLGVYVIQIPFNIIEFLEMSDFDKKRIVVDKIKEGIDKLSYQVDFEMTRLYEACENVINSRYVNEWIWKKPLKIRNRVVQIRIKHEVNEVFIYMVFLDNKDNILKRDLLVRTIPDERIYDMYLGRVVKLSEHEVALITKFDEKYIRMCDE